MLHYIMSQPVELDIEELSSFPNKPEASFKKGEKVKVKDSDEIWIINQGDDEEGYVIENEKSGIEMKDFDEIEKINEDVLKEIKSLEQEYNEEDDDEEEEEDEEVVAELGEYQDEGIKEEDDSTSEEEEEDDEMLRKLEKEKYEDILIQKHPELKKSNYNEIIAMCKIVRNRAGVIVDPLHKTIPWLTKYERARVLGLRAKQISNGADAFIEVPPGMISGHKIAIEELNNKKIPFIIRRPIPNGGSEYWKINDLELLDSC